MYLDTRDLAKKREELKEQILDDFKETFEQYADDTEEYEDILMDEEEIQGWIQDWSDEIEEIEEIDSMEEEIGSEFDYGVTLIPEYYFTEYAKELVTDCGYISRDLPYWIEIDWESTAENVKQDYAEIDYQGKTYLSRS